MKRIQLKILFFEQKLSFYGNCDLSARVDDQMFLFLMSFISITKNAFRSSSPFFYWAQLCFYIRKTCIRKFLFVQKLSLFEKWWLQEFYHSSFRFFKHGPLASRIFRHWSKFCSQRDFLGKASRPFEIFLLLFGLVYKSDLNRPHPTIFEMNLCLYFLRATKNYLSMTTKNSNFWSSESKTVITSRTYNYMLT